MSWPRFTQLAATKMRAAPTGDAATGTQTVEVWNPRPRLLVIGAVHTAQELAPLGRAAGYGITVIDPRTAFGTPARFPDTTVLNDWPDEIIPALAPDRRTAILTLTHDPKIDDRALIAALRSEAFYIGALGSRRTHAKRLERLGEAGFDATALSRIRGPVGLAIGARTPVEIAISIMAEITAVLRRAPLGQRRVKAFQGVRRSMRRASSASSSRSMGSSMVISSGPSRER